MGAESRRKSRRTNERLYESKDSREMEKCSISPLSVRVSVELRPEPRYLRGHRPFSSVGDGCASSLVVSHKRRNG